VFINIARHADFSYLRIVILATELKKDKERKLVPIIKTN
jgi:hypothetical protein